MPSEPRDWGKLERSDADAKRIQPPADDDDAYELADPPAHLQSKSKSVPSDEDDAYELENPRPSISAAPIMPLITADKPRLPSAKSSRGLKIAVLGHILAPLLGLTIGYYILCWLVPDANVLHLPLPGLESPAPAPPPVTP